MTFPEEKILFRTKKHLQSIMNAEAERQKKLEKLQIVSGPEVCRVFVCRPTQHFLKNWIKKNPKYQCHQALCLGLIPVLERAWYATTHQPPIKTAVAVTLYLVSHLPHSPKKLTYAQLQHMFGMTDHPILFWRKQALRDNNVQTWLEAHDFLQPNGK